VRRHAFVLFVACLLAAPAFAGCLVDGGLLRSSLDCTALPTIDKYYQPKTFQWNSIEILSLNRGNEISFWKVTNPAAPTPIGGSYFHVGHQGDSDHDLTSYSICSGCQFGVASYKKAIVVFDMGTGSQPSIGTKYSKYPSTNPRSAFTYKSNDSIQYIISKDLPGASGKVTIFRVNGHNSVTRVRDFPVPPGTIPAPVLGGFDLGGTILLNINGTFYAYSKNGDSLTFIRNTGMKGWMGFYDSAALVGNRVVTAQDSSTDNGLKLWSVASPAYPTLLYTLPGRYKVVGFSGQHVITSQSDGIKTFSVEGNTFAPLDQQFWDPSNPWNQWPVQCSPFMGAAFSNNGNWAYLARFSVFQKINFSGCLGAPTPTPTPTPPPWPTPFPTCVPGGITTELSNGA